MIKKIRGSLTAKIFILIAVLLMTASGITCGGIAGFLPAYYSSQLEQELDIVSREMADTIGSHERIEDAFNAIELFEAGAQVSVVILDEQGNQVWPPVETVVEEAVESVTAEPAESVTAEPEISEEGDYAEAAWADVEENGISNAAADAVSYNEQTAVKHYSLKVGEASYTMMVLGGMQPVNQAIEILHRIFPYILGISAAVALVFALLASLYLTVPVVRLSRTSKNMAALNFDHRYQGKRMDEIGVLGDNLNELSANLSRTLSELRQANERLKSDIERERDIERKRIEFFSAVSHELKTPITILKGHLDGMLQGVGEYRNRDYYLGRSRETAEKMETMVQELLTVSRIENRVFVTERIDVAEQLRQQLADMTELMEEKQISLTVNMPEHLYVEANGAMLEKVFCNLLINAIRYTPGKQGNLIRVVLGAETGEGRAFSCSIENTGVFLPEEALPHVFEAFYRVEQSRNRQTGGSGLGLYIVKMVLDQHKARYVMENTAQGVMFSFEL